MLTCDDSHTAAQLGLTVLTSAVATNGWRSSDTASHCQEVSNTMTVSIWLAQVQFQEVHPQLTDIGGHPVDREGAQTSAFVR